MQTDLPPVVPAEPFTVFRAIPLKAWLLQQLEASPGGVVLDLSAVQDIDTAGVQLLLMLKREAGTRGCPLMIAAPSAPVRELFDLYGLSDDLRALMAADHADLQRRPDG